MGLVRFQEILIKKVWELSFGHISHGAFEDSTECEEIESLYVLWCQYKPSEIAINTGKFHRIIYCLIVLVVLGLRLRFSLRTLNGLFCLISCCVANS